MPNQTFYNLPEEKRMKIIQAAINEFSTHTFNRTSINRIVDSAQIPKGSFYQYFEDKTDIYLYIISHEILRLEDRLLKNAEGFQDVIKLLNISEKYIDIIGETTYELIKKLKSAPDYIVREWICQFAIPYSLKFYQNVKKGTKRFDEEEIDEDFPSYVMAVFAYFTFEYGKLKKLSTQDMESHYVYIDEIIRKGLKIFN